MRRSWCLLLSLSPLNCRIYTRVTFFFLVDRLRGAHRRRSGRTLARHRRLAEPPQAEVGGLRLVDGVGPLHRHDSRHGGVERGVSVLLSPPALLVSRRSEEKTKTNRLPDQTQL